MKDSKSKEQGTTNHFIDILETLSIKWFYNNGIIRVLEWKDEEQHKQAKKGLSTICLLV